MQDQRTCPHCGTPFVADSNYPGRKYCSAACGNAARKARSRVEKDCERCGTPFIAKRHEIARGSGKYCSMVCRDASNPGPSPELIARLRERKGDRNPCYRGDDIGIAAAHDRVRAIKGRAREHDCVECGDTARDWALIHTATNTRTAPNGRVYSLEVEDYQPMCRRCHVHYDHGGEFERYFGANAGRAA